MDLPYADRRAAGLVLAERVLELALDDTIVLGLPRGGVVVAAPVAEALLAPLDVWCVRKVGVPGHEELALGAVSTGGVQVFEQHLIDRFGYSEEKLRALVAPRLDALTDQERTLRGNRPPPQVKNRAVVLVDDGLATGSTARAACQSVRQAGAGFVVLAVPVASTGGLRTVTDTVDHVVCPAVPMRFHAVGEWYRDFSEVTDDEVVELLGRR